jgi:hypothetical protein
MAQEHGSMARSIPGSHLRTKAILLRDQPRLRRALVTALALYTGLGAMAAADNAHAGAFVSGALVVSRIQYNGTDFATTDTFPTIFNDPNISGIQGSIYLDQYLPIAGSRRLATLPLTGITTSFSSKSEGALTLSVNKKYLTYIGYEGPVGAQGVSNSETPGATLSTNTAATYDREIALIAADGTVTLIPETNAYSGDNPRAVITVDGTQFYMAGNADSSLNKDGTGPGTTIGARYATPGSDTSYELGVYFAADRPDETAKQHIKDRNFRAIGIYQGNLYVAKGSGANGDDGVFQVLNGLDDGLPTGSSNTIAALISTPATDPVSGAASPLTPFGFWFADRNTLYVADEGYANLDANGNLVPDPLAGLQKWSLVNGAWKLDYTLTAGLDLYKAQNVSGYPVPTYTTGIRNLTGRLNRDGTVTVYAITAQYSTVSGGEPDPTRLVAIRDVLSATTLPKGSRAKSLEKFETLQQSRGGEVFRGVAFAPCTSCSEAGR